MRALTVGMLKAFLEYMDDDARVVVTAPDHEYSRTYTAGATTAILADGVLSEDHEGELEDGETRVDVCVID